MSSFSDYGVGTISYDEFKSYSRRECEDPYDRYTCRDCSEFKACCEQIHREGCPMCEQGEKYETDFSDAYEVYEAMQDKDFLMCNYGCDAVESILRDFDSIDIQADYREWNNENHHSNNNSDNGNSDNSEE